MSLVPAKWECLGRTTISAGIVWKAYRTGTDGEALVSTTKPFVVVRANAQTKTATYCAKVGKNYIGKRYRSEDAALEHAAKHLREIKATLHVSLD